MPGRARAGFDYVVIARQATVTRPFSDLTGDLEQALERSAAGPRAAGAKASGAGS